MAKYKFRLTTLQKIREVNRDRERAALAEAFRAEQILAERRAELVAEEIQLRQLQRIATTDHYLDVNQLLEAQRYELVLKARSTELAGHEALLSAETERRRQQLIEADREVRVLERLDERQRQEHNKRQQRQETKHLDEAANRRPTAWGHDHS